jgi:ubiquinone/menaquinone biosynthesis C-methylase UbiE
MKLLSTPTNAWTSVLGCLQCVDCGKALDADGPEGLTCTGCRRAFPIRDQILETMQPLGGNNKVAADFYNGPLWPRFRFWEWFAFFINGGERRSRRKIMQHLPDLSGTRILEVAIGDGSNLPLIPDDCQVFGNDISTVQLAGCQQRFPDRDLHLVLGEAEKLPFRDRTFDHVLSVGAFNYFNDPLQSLREMARVVKPGGLIVVSDEVPDLPNKTLFGRWIGLPQLDRWVMSRFMHLGPEFTDMVDRHRDLKLEPIAREVLDDWSIHSLWARLGYCIVGKAKL